MKYFIILLICLFFMSFDNLETNQEKFKIVLLTNEDWECLKKITIKGTNTISVVDYKTRFHFITTVQYQQETIEISKKQRNKLQEILSKYE